MMTLDVLNPKSLGLGKVSRTTISSHSDQGFRFIVLTYGTHTHTNKQTHYNKAVAIYASPY